MRKIGRNHRCPCGSGKKYKHCCLRLANPELLPSTDAALPTASGSFEAGLLDTGSFESLVYPRFEITAISSELAEELGHGQWPLRSFDIVEVIIGHGVWVVESTQGAGSDERIFVADETASYVFDPGNSFGAEVPPNEPIRVPPFWRGCEHCAELIRERRELAAVSQSVSQ